MAMSLLTTDGLIADRATTSNDHAMTEEHKKETEMNVNPDDQTDKRSPAGKSGVESSDTECSFRTDGHNARQENLRKRKRDQPGKLEQKLERSDTALKSLKKHLDRKTCPKSLQYRARARIKADDDFKKDIKRLRSKAEEDYIQALIRFRYRNIEGLRSAIRQGKRVQANKSKKTEEHCKQKKTAFARSAPKEPVNKSNVTQVSRRIDELKAEIMSLSSLLDVNNKQKRDYTCLLSDSPNIERGHGQKKSSQIRNKK